MISVEEASNIISHHLDHSFFLTPQVRADRNYPPFHRVMMDGIALNFESYQQGKKSFEIQGICPAGKPAGKLSGGCLEVMTGAPLPEGADVVIPYEQLKIKDSIAQIITDSPRERWENVHLEGSDCKKGEMILPGGLLWNGPRMGIVTSVGEDSRVSQPKVLLISTGDELVEKDPLPHQIRRSNVYALKESLKLYGRAQIKIDHLEDDPVKVQEHYQKNVQDFDLLIYSGGVSKGKFDYLPSVWHDLGVKKLFHGVSQRPGRPLWFGVDEKHKTVVTGLPGNPISSLTCLHRYFFKNRFTEVMLDEDFSFSKSLTYFLPVKLTFREAVIRATPVKVKNSGEFSALAESDGFIELPLEKNHFKRGELFRFYSWRPF